MSVATRSLGSMSALYLAPDNVGDGLLVSAQQVGFALIPAPL